MMFVTRSRTSSWDNKAVSVAASLMRAGACTGRAWRGSFTQKPVQTGQRRRCSRSQREAANRATVVWRSAWQGIPIAVSLFKVVSRTVREILTDAAGCDISKSARAQCGT